MVGGQGAIRRRLNRNCCLRLRRPVAVETQAVMESRRVGEGRETGARRGGDSWIRSPHAHISHPTQRQLKTQIASPLLPGKVDIFRAFGKNSDDSFLLCVCVFPSSPLIEADIEECGSVASSASVPRLHNPGSPLSPGVMNQTLGTCWRSVL